VAICQQTVSNRDFEGRSLSLHSYKKTLPSMTIKPSAKLFTRQQHCEEIMLSIFSQRYIFIGNSGRFWIQWQKMEKIAIFKWFGFVTAHISCSRKATMLGRAPLSNDHSPEACITKKVVQSQRCAVGAMVLTFIDRTIRILCLVSPAFVL